MVQGTVKWYNAEKGYGFLAVGGGPDVFVRWTSIQADGYKTLHDGQAVEFEAVESPRGMEARRVRPL